MRRTVLNVRANLSRRKKRIGPIAEKIISEQIDPTEALAGFSHEDYPDVESQLDAIQHILIDDWAQNIPLTTELKATFAKTAVLKVLLHLKRRKKWAKSSAITLNSLNTKQITITSFIGDVT